MACVPEFGRWDDLICSTYKTPLWKDAADFIKYRLENHNSDSVNIKTGMAIAQGIFMNYLKTNDDDADGVRNGGFGSTDKK